MGTVPAGLAAYQASHKKNSKPANDSKTAPTRAGSASDQKSAPADSKAGPTPDPNAYGGFKLHEKVVVPSLNNATGTIVQLANHSGKPVCEVKLSNGHTDWFTLKEIAAVPADPIPAVVPNADPSMPPAAPADPSQTQYA